MFHDQRDVIIPAYLYDCNLRGKRRQPLNLLKRFSLFPCKTAEPFLVRNAFETYKTQTVSFYFSANFSRRSKLPQVNKTHFSFFFLFFFQPHKSDATWCKVNTEMTFSGKLETEVHDQNATYIFAVMC